MSAPISIIAWSDYVCPWCYLGQGELMTLKNDYEFEIDWQPFLLRPETTDAGWELPEQFKRRRNSPDNPLAVRAKALGLTLVERDLIPPTRRAHQATEFARDQGKLEPFHAALLERYWARGANINDVTLLKEVASEVGLDADELGVALEARTYESRVQASIDEAHHLGVDGVPFFVIGQKFAVQGAQPAAVFRQAFERLKAGV